MPEMYGEPAIEARGLRKAFDGTVAVDGLDLAVLAGEVFGLVGPDGAGKTTTMRMLCGALSPTDGAARVAGFDVIVQPEEVKRRIGYVPQRFSLYPELTVDENVLFQARVHGVVGKTFEDRREQLLSFSRLGRFRKRLAQDLSGGMRQKLALICALIHQPEILLMDEPTTGVDPVSRGEFWELLLGLASEGSTIMAATAYMDEAERCRRVGLLYRGRLLIAGTPREIRREARLTLLQVACNPLRPGQRTMQRLPGVRWAEVFGDRVHAAVERLEIEDVIRRALEKAGVEVTAVRPIETGLEDAFFELVRRRSEELG
jgi:ABC-2 type transport system ATP-binding protein